MFRRTIILRCFQKEEGGVCLPRLTVPCSPSLLRAWGADLGGVPRHPPCSLGPDRDLLTAFVCSLAGQVGSTEIRRSGASKAAGRVAACGAASSPPRLSAAHPSVWPAAPQPQSHELRAPGNEPVGCGVSVHQPYRDPVPLGTQEVHSPSSHGLGVADFGASKSSAG